ncbi:MAG: diacylglycerol kinase [Gammaproteobacteria bacterium]|jgi:diacylglycerol kinase
MKNQSLKNKLRNALAGIRHAWATEDNVRTHGAIAVCVVLVFLWIRPEPVWWGLIVLCIGLVVAAELLNSALEILIDHLHPEIHPAIGRAKDVLAGMVLVLSLTAVVVGALAVADSLL